MTLLVIFSHYFGELEHGLPVKVGWLAVDMFFVLSGFLIGKLILEKRHHANFFAVFYVRRICRIIPAYMITILLLGILLHFVPKPWLDTDVEFPLWSYLTFNQVFFMVADQNIGNHWLAPTWTLAFEEHFYLVAPALIVFTPRRWLIPVLLAVTASALCLRLAIYYFGFLNEMAALVLLPMRADIIVCGLLAAVAVKSEGISWTRWIPVLRVAPVAALLAITLLHLVSLQLFYTLSPLLISVGGTAYLLCIFHGTPEAHRFKSKTLQFFGNNGYCLYLTHLPVLGIMHGVILGSPPDLATLSQWLVTLAALPVCVLVGWGMTKLIEEPLTAYGRSWRWATKERRPFRAAAQSEP
jgi:peptidoglycan/LPS O-acetylase OafA/YrhL